MPVSLITLHAYGTWLPDRPEGYSHHTRGRLPPDEFAAKQYRDRQREPTLYFNESMQRLLIETTIAAQPLLETMLYGAATDATHYHVLRGWTDTRSGEQVRTRLKQGLSRALNSRYHRRTWFIRNGWCEAVTAERHFDWLREEYFPDHRGWCWDRDNGWREPTHPV